MSAPRFFCVAPLASAAIGTTMVLPEATTAHAVRALRLGPNDPIVLFDGHGGEYRATLAEVGRRSASARIDAFDAVERETPAAVTLVPAVIATDPMDFMVRKAVELGVAAIEPVVAVRSQGVLAGERAKRRVAHWRAIAVAACEQCGRNRVPSVAAPVALASWLERFDGESGSAVMLAPGAQVALAALAATQPPRCVLLGPEGGFHADELALAARRGVVAVHLGARVLRAETAALAALATINAVAENRGQTPISAEIGV